MKKFLQSSKRCVIVFPIHSMEETGNSSGRSAHLLRRPYENVVAGGIQPIKKRFSMAGCVTVQGLSELLRKLNIRDMRILLITS